MWTASVYLELLKSTCNERLTGCLLSIQSKHILHGLLKGFTLGHQVSWVHHDQKHVLNLKSGQVGGLYTWFAQTRGYTLKYKCFIPSLPLECQLFPTVKPVWVSLHPTEPIQAHRYSCLLHACSWAGRLHPLVFHQALWSSLFQRQHWEAAQWEAAAPLSHKEQRLEVPLGLESKPVHGRKRLIRCEPGTDKNKLKISCSYKYFDVVSLLECFQKTRHSVSDTEICCNFQVLQKDKHVNRVAVPHKAVRPWSNKLHTLSCFGFLFKF